MIHRAKVKAGERLDGKFVVHDNDDTLSAEDMALGRSQKVGSGLATISLEFARLDIVGTRLDDERIPRADSGRD